jgi:hypothetical protein
MERQTPVEGGKMDGSPWEAYWMGRAMDAEIHDRGERKWRG